MVSAALMVRLPAAPISSFWLALLSAMAEAETAVPSIFNSDPTVVPIASTRPLLTVPSRSSVPPLAVTVPVPDSAVFAAIVPCRSGPRGWSA